MLKLENISIVKNLVPILTKLNLKIEQGACIHLIGQNGIGKSSLLRVLAGLNLPASGRIQNEQNQELSLLDLTLGSHFLGEKFGFRNTKVKDFVAWMSKIYAHSQSKNMPLEVFEQQSGLAFLEEVMEREIESLSSGQKKRLQLLPLFVEKRQLWLLDEVFALIDSGTKENWLFPEMQKHLQEGGAIVIAHHGSLPMAGVEEFDLGAFAS